MRRISSVAIGGGAAVLSASLLAPVAKAQGIPILSASDTAIGIDADAVFALNGRYPTNENPAKALDATLGTKYLNFGGAGSGFIVTPSAATPVESFQIRTGNDAPGRDPASWALYGFNGTLTTTDSGATPAINLDGLAEAWTLIGSGSVTLPGNPSIGNDQRGVLGPVVDVPTGVGYQHYKMIFPTVKSIGSILQFDEIQFYGDDAATPAQAILAPVNPIIAVDELKAWSGSSFPGGENPARGIDQSIDLVTLLPNTKYLNFGEEKSGLIITNAEGAAQVINMRLTTAGDAPERDPTSFELYGTNDAIQSTDNTDGNRGEVYTLIASGALTLPDARNDSSTVVAINASAAYASFKLIFPTVKNAASANSMQIADVQFYAVPEPTSLATGLLGLAAACGAARRRP